MLQTSDSRRLLAQVADSLNEVTDALASVKCVIDGRLASFEATTEQWQPHPDVPATEMRRWPAPPGASYAMLEVRSQAGAQAGRVVLSHAADMHVLSGRVSIQREGQAAPEFYAAGSCGQFRAQEPHGFEVLQDCHNLVILHFHP